MITIEVLRIIWWVLLGILFMGFAVMDGFDLGAATLLPLVARNEIERRIVLNTIGPVWEGNQVWIILGAGAIFAAWPYVYAVAFSGAYLAVLLLLLSMGISRPVSFKYRSKLKSHVWRRTWDWIVFFGGCLPAFIFGVLFGNAMLGLPFRFDEDLRIFYDGTFLELFSPFALYCGLTSLTMLTMHGGLYLAIKTEDPIRKRALFWSQLAACMTVILFACGGLLVLGYVSGYQLVDGANPLGDSNPLHKHVVPRIGAWIDNYYAYPASLILPALGIAGSFLAFLFARVRNSHFAFVCSSLGMMGIIGTVGVSMFPFLLPSSINMASSLLIWDASSSYLTLLIMLVATLIFMPIILVYTSWVYYVLRGKVKAEMIEEDKQHIAY